MADQANRAEEAAGPGQPDPQPDPVPAATRPAPRPLNASLKPRKLSKDWSETLDERHSHQNVNLADLLYFKKGCSGRRKTKTISTSLSLSRRQRKKRKNMFEDDSSYDQMKLCNKFDIIFHKSAQSKNPVDFVYYSL